MRNAVLMSLIFHAVIIASTMVILPSLSPSTPPEMQIIPVEMVKVAEETRLKPQEKKQKIAEAPEKEEPERKVEMPPPPPKVASTTPMPDLKPKPEPKEPEKKPAEKAPKQTARVPDVTPRAKPRRFNTGKLAALLDKRVEKEPSITERLKDKDFGEQKVISDIDTRQQTLSIAHAIDQHIYENQCWNPPAGAKGAAGLKVTVRVRLSVEGNIIGAPRVLESARMNAPGEGFYRAAAESALRAVRKCAPFDFLPKEQYSLWREMDINFDPEYMLGG